VPSEAPGGDTAADGGAVVVAKGGDLGPQCGRLTTTPCGVGAPCNGPLDCADKLCTSGACQAAAPADGIKNGDETAIDCGGTKSPACADGQACLVTTDCMSQVCTGNICQAPSPTDGVENADETGVDCGGLSAPKCKTGAGCLSDADCDKVRCDLVLKQCAAVSSTDGLVNGDETGIDCGGPTVAARCATGQGCAANGDCDNVACDVGGTNLCLAATSGDSIKNGTETDIDCGGGAPTNAPRCAVDKACVAHGDCASSACAISGPKAGLCVPRKSCVKDAGGFTCGRDDRDFGDVTVALETCCSTAPIVGSAAKLDRFSITAGRMRAFIERVNGDVRGYVQAPATKPAGWSAAWDVLVPSTIDEAETMLGPSWNNAPNDPNTTTESPHSKRSCGYAGFNGHTYWVSNQPQASQVFTQAELDPKVLNCVGWHLVRAFCAWDGGRMATAAELQNAFTNGSTSAYPWGYAGSPYNGAYTPTAQDDRLNHVYRYGFPGAQPASFRITWWLSPPGRFWRGWNKNGVEIAGNTLEWTGDAEYNFAWNFSFENHTGNMNNGNDWRSPNDRTDVPNGYYALGARCVYP
jgi:hypothetical protein